MPLDAVFLRGVAKELDLKLRGSRIDKIYQPSKSVFTFFVRADGVNSRLIVYLSGKPRVYLSSEKRENPETVPPLCMLLRKHIAGAKIISVNQAGLERVLTIKLECYDELGEKREKSLVIELIGNHANMVLADDSGRIIDAAKRIDYEQSAERPILPGLFYRLPPAPQKLSVENLTRGNIEKKLENISFGKPCDKWILDCFCGISPLACREIAFSVLGSVDADISAASAEQKRRLADLLLNISQNLGNVPPYILYNAETNKPFDFCFMPVDQYGSGIESQKRESYNAVLAEFFDNAEKEENLDKRKRETLKIVINLRDKLLHKLEEQKKELENAKNREQIRRNADIIMANLRSAQKGADFIVLQDIFDENAPQIKIKLDKKLDLRANAVKFYKEYGKLKNAESFLTKQIENGQTTLLYLNSIIDETERCTDIDEIKDINEELAAMGYIKTSCNKRKRNAKEREINPREYRTHSGKTVLVGRNNRENEILTLKKAGFRDIWFHVKNAPGAHTVLCIDGENPSEQDIFDAAVLAAYHSGMKNSSQIPVDYTEIRYVKKLNGAGFGMVTYKNQKTLFVTPDAKIIDELSSDE